MGMRENAIVLIWVRSGLGDLTLYHCHRKNGENAKQKQTKENTLNNEGRDIKK
jgi:hypothetical protein